MASTLYYIYVQRDRERDEPVAQYKRRSERGAANQLLGIQSAGQLQDNNTRITTQGITSRKTIARMVHGINRERLDFETPYLRLLLLLLLLAVLKRWAAAAAVSRGSRGAFF